MAERTKSLSANRADMNWDEIIQEDDEIIQEESEEDVPQSAQKTAQPQPQVALTEQFHTLILTDLAYTRILLSHIVRAANSLASLADSPLEAWRLLRTNNFNLIMVDFCRKEDEAQRFLLELRGFGFTQPLIIFYSDTRQDTSVALGLAPVMWVRKPFASQNIQDIIARMMNGETEKLFSVEAADAPRLESSAESTIQKIIGGLPALPSAMEKIMANVNRPDISAGEVAKLAAYSPNLAVSLLRLVNSAHFGLKQRVTSIHHAAVFLGVNTVQSLLLGLASQTLFNSKGNFIDMKRLWRHSLGVALVSVSRELASRIQCSLSPGEAFTAGLLHDFGKIIWDQYLPEQIQMVKELMKTEEIDGHVAEKRVLGVDHGWVGGRVGDVWNFPSQLCEPIRHHHEPHLASSHWEAVCIVRAADVICVNSGLCYWTEFFPQDIDEHTQQMLGITSVMASSLSENLPQKVEDLDLQFKSG